MKPSEKIVAEALSHLGYTNIVYEPDGNISPDFLIDGRIAVEVRVLNQNHMDETGPRSLEEDAIPLIQKVGKLLSSLGAPTDHKSWFVLPDFCRPIESWKSLAPKIRTALAEFVEIDTHDMQTIKITKNFEIDLIRTSDPHLTRFVLGGYSDDDAGGWVVAEVIENLKLCVSDKATQLAGIRARYPECWLILPDLIGYGLDESDRQAVREELAIEHHWDKIMIVDPTNPKRVFEL